MEKNVASQKWRVFAFDKTNNNPKTGDAANISAKISKDWGVKTATNDVAPTEIEDGYYEFDLTQAESNAKNLDLYPESSTANIQVIGVPGNIVTTPKNHTAMGIESDGDLTKVNTLNGHTAQTGDSFARLGAPVGASISADLAVVDGNVDDIETLLNSVDSKVDIIDGNVDDIEILVNTIDTNVSALNNLSKLDVAKSWFDQNVFSTLRTGIVAGSPFDIHHPIVADSFDEANGPTSQVFTATGTNSTFATGLTFSVIFTDLESGTGNTIRDGNDYLGSEIINQSADGSKKTWHIIGGYRMNNDGAPVIVTASKFGTLAAMADADLFRVNGGSLPYTGGADSLGEEDRNIAGWTFHVKQSRNTADSNATFPVSGNDLQIRSIVGGFSKMGTGGDATLEKQNTILADLSVVDGNVDDIETLLNTVDGKVDIIDNNVDDIETLLNTVDGKIDTIDNVVDAIKDKTDLLPEAIKRNTAVSKFPFMLVSSSDDVSPFTGGGTTVISERSIDGTAFVTMENSNIEVGSGMYAIDLEALDDDGIFITYKFSKTGARTRYISFKTAS